MQMLLIYNDCGRTALDGAPLQNDGETDDEACSSESVARRKWLSKVS